MSGKKRDYISFSAMNMYCKCGMQYMLHYEEGVKVPPTTSLINGKEYHGTLEVNHRQKVESRVDLPLQDLKDLYADGVQKAFQGEVLLKKDENDLGKVEVLDKTLLRGFAALEVYHRDLAPTRQPLEMEKEFKIRLSDDLPPLYGFIDLITEGMVVIDDKTAQKTPAKDEAEKSLQLSTYALAFNDLYGYLPPELRLDYVVVTPKTNKGSASPLSTARNQGQLDRFIKRLRLVVDGICKGVFIPPEQGHWACGYCGYGDMGLCPL